MHRDISVADEMKTYVNLSQNTNIYRKLFSRLHREIRDTELNRVDVGASSSAMEVSAYSVFRIKCLGCGRSDGRGQRCRGDIAKSITTILINGITPTSVCGRAA